MSRLTDLATVEWTVPALTALLAGGSTTAVQVVDEAYRRLVALDDPAALLHVRPRDKALAAAASAGAPDQGRPLAGVPFVVKDNIDVAGMPTTAACASFGGVATRSATVVARLEAAGALCIAKSNLDQFATGLAGTRSPAGIPRNPVDAGFVPGGSSSGSAVVVAAGVVPFALGTDTAGSGRVPASFCGLVGLKPTVGLVPTDGVVPAVAELDCVSVFAPDVAGARLVLAVMADDPELGRTASSGPGTTRTIRRRVATPTASGLATCDDATRLAFTEAVDALRARGWETVEVDVELALAAGRLLYAPGPWLRARHAAFGAHLAAHPDTADPTVAGLVLAADEDHEPGTVDDAARRELDALRGPVGALLDGVDVLALPVSPSIPTLRAALDDPVGTSRRLGTYTNFVNLLGLCAASVPVGTRGRGLPCGLMLVARPGHDALLADLAATLTLDGQGSCPPVHTAAPAGHVDLAVVGAHLRGLPLNTQLTANGATFVRATVTTPDYRLVALPDSLPPNPGPARPGLVRVADGTGRAIAVELWRLPVAGLGALVTGVPAPLAIGTTRLHDGSSVLGFMCEGIAAEGAPDLSAWGGWRAWLADGAPVPS